MYEAFYGFRERPFQLTPNPRYLFLNPAHREALATLRYGLSSSLGITVLLGETGTGKTTLLRAALRAEGRPEQRHVVLTNPTLTPAELFEMLAERLGLPQPSGSKARFLLSFERDLLERHHEGVRTAVVIDEAQNLTRELFEEIRLLANLETETEKLVNLVLVGQPELAERLNDPSLRQFKQRVVLRCSLPPLDLEWTASYIAGRLTAAGAVAADVFTKEAVRAIYEASRGIPRAIGVVGENALLAGYAAQRKPVDRSIVANVCRDLDIPLSGRTASEFAVEEPPAGAWRHPAPSHASSDGRPVELHREAPMLTPGRRILDFLKELTVMRTLVAAVFALTMTGQTTVRAQASATATPQPATAAAASVPVDRGASVRTEPGFTVGPEDVLGVLFWHDSEMTGDVTVRPDGMITLPLVRDVRAAGLTPDELADRIQAAAREYITDASVTVVVRQVNSRKVFITGEVAHPGSYPLGSSMTVMQLIAVAGGLTEFAEPRHIAIMRLDGGHSTMFDFDYREVARGRKREQNIVLKPGDTIVVSER